MLAYGFFSVSLLVLTFSFSLIARVDVLKDWTLELPAGEIHAGDQVVVESIYTKTMDVTGEASRFIECKSDRAYVRYPVSKAVANRSAGSTGTGIVFVIPKVIPDLPATCRMNVTIDYEVLAFRHVIESNTSSEFQLLPPR